MIKNIREQTLDVLEKIVFPLENKCFQIAETCHKNCWSSSIYLYKKNDTNNRGYPAGRFLLEISTSTKTNTFLKTGLDYLDNIDYIDWTFLIKDNFREKYFELKIKFTEGKYIISTNKINCSYQYGDYPNEEGMTLIISELERYLF